MGRPSPRLTAIRKSKLLSFRQTKIIQKLYENELLTLTKTVTFGSDGLTISEEVK